MRNAARNFNISNQLKHSIYFDSPIKLFSESFSYIFLGFGWIIQLHLVEFFNTSEKRSFHVRLKKKMEQDICA